MKTAPLIFFALAFAGFVAGLVHLFHLRFEAGDNYPAYSTLRADPLGSKALYESLEPLRKTRRHLRTLGKLSDGNDTTLFWLGAESQSLRFLPSEYHPLETFVRSGGRLVITLAPQQQAPRVNRFAVAGPGPRRVPPGGTNAPPVRPGDPPLDPSPIPVGERWQLEFDHAPLQFVDRKIVPEEAILQRTNLATRLPRSLLVHTATHFARAGAEWDPIYSRVANTNVYPVIIERRFGRGSIVFCADSYPFSNEALRSDREPQLIAWSVGSAPEVVFDETHLGITHEPGVAALLREYRLGTFFIALLALAGLFVWRNSVSFMPPSGEDLEAARTDMVEGKDSASGFVNLLKRNIPPKDLMKLCIEQWNASAAHARRPSAARLEAMQERLAAENRKDPRDRNPVELYRDFSTILKRRN